MVNTALTYSTYTARHALTLKWLAICGSSNHNAYVVTAMVRYGMAYILAKNVDQPGIGTANPCVNSTTMGNSAARATYHAILQCLLSSYFSFVMSTNMVATFLV